MTTPDPTDNLKDEHTDLIIIGAGIVGLAHAFQAHRKGYTVRIIERDAKPNGASIRNFGHCCITAQDGEHLDTAYRSREGWLAAAQAIGFWAPEAGAVVVARSQTELAVLEQLSDKRGTDNVQLLTAEQTTRRLTSAGTPDPTICGGAFLPADLRVDPRTAAPDIADWLQNQDGIKFLWGTAVKDIQEGGSVITSRGDFHAGKVLVCVGHDLDYLLPDVAARYQVQRCALQMAMAPAPPGYKLDSAVLTGTSMTRYDGFTTMPAADALRQEIYSHSPELIDMGANVMFTRRPDGTVLLGDSHVYGQTIGPFQDEWMTSRLVREVEKLLGSPLIVTQRWQGIYASSPLTSLLVEDIGSTTTAITVTSGIGMTLSFGIAAETIERL
ncbi:FAD dependent oxidoreductase TIGR03364 [Arthrobacter sp. V4I6]|uniref:TIGR03364 family FAD-dependent oxidoreductase n=1 Tax=unclassified Arthrobacter TaxID=235627 RepID=UPI00278746DB|nr:MULTISPECIES: TIGR03364 family FAD-dependent oxidoreductase [unclassified Arthrobacter]MDQ0821305.1 FAD dependent oxidoreductase TIGR03364 [Arthrobacter sp. V1I7]MDQ0855570.1 FAD dependent oxidoreductase TIGR03364 [Arthrobacter sp. V4I6]